MKSVVLFSIAAILLLAAGYFAITTVSEQTGQRCASGDEVNSYRNTWQDVYFVWQWWSNRSAGTVFIDCVGPATYLRYHPYDVVAVSLAAAGVVGYIGMNDKPKRGKKL